jgi:hypothetical protein
MLRFARGLSPVTTRIDPQFPRSLRAKKLGVSVWPL